MTKLCQPSRKVSDKTIRDAASVNTSCANATTMLKACDITEARSEAKDSRRQARKHQPTQSSRASTASSITADSCDSSPCISPAESPVLRRTLAPRPHVFVPPMPMQPPLVMSTPAPALHLHLQPPPPTSSPFYTASGKQCAAARTAGVHMAAPLIGTGVSGQSMFVPPLPPPLPPTPCEPRAVYCNYAQAAVCAWRKPRPHTAVQLSLLPMPPLPQPKAHCHLQRRAPEAQQLVFAKPFEYTSGAFVNVQRAHVPAAPLAVAAQQQERSTAMTQYVTRREKEELLWKTELCMRHVAGTCHAADDKCPFAHGAAQLRAISMEARVRLRLVPVPHLHKTEHCHSWVCTGACNYGARCLFVHCQCLGTVGAVDTTRFSDAGAVLMTGRVNSSVHALLQGLVDMLNMDGASAGRANDASHGERARTSSSRLPVFAAICASGDNMQ